MPVLPSPSVPPSRRRRMSRLIRYARLRVAVRLRRLTLVPMVRAGTAVYFAAAALIGFEGIEVLLGAFVLGPELVPLALVALAAVWYARREGRRLRLLVLLARRAVTRRTRRGRGIT